MSIAGEDLRLAATDGFALAATRFAPEHPRVRTVIASATGVPRAYYARFAAALAEAGSDVVTFDYRGIGGSRPAPRDVRLVDWATRDLEAALGFGDERLPLTVVGHSIGTQLLGLAPSASRVERVLSIAGQSGDFRHWRGAGRAAMATLWFAAIPTVAALLGEIPSWMGMGDGVPGGVARDWAAWGRTRGYLLADAAHRAAYATVRAEMRAVAISDDAYAPEAAVRALMSGYSNARWRLDVLAPSAIGQRTLGHFGWFKKGAAALWPSATAFLVDGA